MTKTDALLRQFGALKVWKKGDVRAPHKPLLVLLALGKISAGNDRLLAYNDIRDPLTELLEDFGPPRKSHHPELPFYHLQSDGVWEIDEHVTLTGRTGSKNFLESELLEFRICGGFTPEIYSYLKMHPEAVRALAKQLLEAHFAESLHESIANSVGLDLSGTIRNSRRDPAFRSEVIAVWGRACAFCGFSVQLDRADIALDAAHIRWCQAGGPDSVNNGLACCSIHHQAFDRGAITISGDSRILVSSRLYGSGRLDEMFIALHKRPLGTPNRKDAMPKPEFLEWHRTQVFRGLARD